MKKYQKRIKLTITAFLFFMFVLSLCNSSPVINNNSQIQINNDEKLFAAGPIDPLRDYNGTGEDISITINGTGYGNSTSNPALDDGWIRVKPDQTIAPNFTILTPSAQNFNNIVLEATAIEKTESQTVILNETVVFYPNYTISYTNNSNFNLTESTFINITAFDSPEMPLGNINIYVNNTLDHASGAYFGNKSFSHEIIFSEQCEAYIIVEFMYASGVKFRDESFFVYCSEADNQVLTRISPDSARHTDFLKLNNFITASENRSPNRAALKINIGETTNFDSFSVYARWNMAAAINMTITNNLVGGSNLGGGMNNVTGSSDGEWLNLYFNDPTTVAAGEYWVVFHLISFEDLTDDSKHFSLAYINWTEGQNQDTQYYNRSTSAWQNFGFNFLANYTTYSWIPANLSEVNINASIRLANMTNEIKPFDQLTGLAIYDEPISYPVSTTFINVQFNSNIKARFKIDYSLEVSISTTMPLSFEYSNGTEYVRWFGNYTQVMLSESEGRTIFPAQNYSFVGYNSFVLMNATNGTDTVEISSNTLIIDSILGAFASEWEINGYTTPKNCNIRNAEGTKQFQKGKFLNIGATYIVDRYITNMTIWGNEELINSSYRERVSSNRSNAVQFDPIYIQPDLSYDTIIVRVDWNDGTQAGISYKEFFVEEGSEISVSNSEIYIVSGNNGSFSVNYTDLENHLVPDAVIFTNWSDVNWSYTFSSQTGYVFQITTDSIPLAESGFIQVNFTHTYYQNQSIQVKVIHVIPSILEVNHTDSSIYLGNNFYMDFGYYSDEGSPLSLHDANISIYVDGKDCGYQIYRPGGVGIEVANILIRMNSAHTNFPNNSGNYSYSVFFSFMVDGKIYENKSYSSELEIKRAPSALTLLSSSAYKIDKDLQEFVEYEKLDDPMEIYVSYFVRKASAQSLEEDFTADSEIPVWVEVYESGLKVSYQMDYIGQGMYKHSIQTNILPAGSNNIVKIYTNHPYYEEKNITYVLKIIPKLTPIITLGNIQGLKEKTKVDITGNVMLDNGTVKTPLVNRSINVEIIFSGSDTNQSFSYVVKTDENGDFVVKEVEIPYQKDYQMITVIISLNNSREYDETALRTSAAIKEYLLAYITSGVVVSLFLLILLTFLSIKYFVPSIKSRIAEKKIIRKIEKRTMDSRMGSLKKGDGVYLRVAKRNPDADPFLISTLPENADSPSDDESDSDTEILKIEDETSKTKRATDIIKGRTQELMESVGLTQKQPEVVKQRSLHSAVKFEARERYNEALESYKIALKMAKELKDKEEIAAIEEYIKICERKKKDAKSGSR